MNKYKVSSFRIIKKDTKAVVYIADNNAVFHTSSKKVSKFLEEFLNKFINKTLEEDKLFIQFNNYKLRKDLLREFVEIGLVKHEGYYKGEKIKVDSLKFTPTSLVLNITSLCNLSCKYCYRGKKQGADGAKKNNMDFRTAVEIIDYFFGQSKRNAEKKIVFFGGEPLLNFELIKKVVSYVEEKYISKGENIKFIITTNGTLINHDIARFLVDKKFSISISLDGYKDIHDLCRVYPNGKGSYFESINGFNCVKEYDNNYPVSVRATVTKQTNNLLKSYKHLKCLSFIEIGFAPVSIESKSELNLSTEDLKKMFCDVKKISEEYFDDISNHVYPKFSNLTNMLSLIHRGDSFLFPCGACLGLVAVNPDGKFYPCHRLSFEKFKIGDISKGVDEVKRRRFLERILEVRMKKCGKCDVRYLCSGGCYYESEIYFKKWYAPNTHYCDFMKKFSYLALELYCQIYENYPRFLDILTNECNQI